MKSLRKIGIAVGIIIIAIMMTSSCSGCKGSKCNECPKFSNTVNDTINVVSAEENH